MQSGVLLQAALIATTAAAEVLSSSIEGEEGAEGPADEAAAQAVAQILLQLLVRLSAVKGSSEGADTGRLQLLKLQLMQSLAPALMRHLATTGGQAQVRGRKQIRVRHNRFSRGDTALPLPARCCTCTMTCKVK